MTRKRFVKLLMAQGYSRNHAQRIALAQQQERRSYAEAYDVLTPGRWQLNAQAFGEALREMVNALEIAVEAILAGVEAFGDAFNRTMNKRKS